LIEFALREPKLECGVFVRPAQFSERLSKDGDAALKFRVACRNQQEHPDTPDPFGLLRAPPSAMLPRRRPA
jgi:hypothetical protein